MVTENQNPRLWMYHTMVKSRYYEAQMKLAYLEGKQPVFNMAKGPVPGEMHLSDGQEPCAVGVCALLRPSDIVNAPHRAHHLAIAKGVDLDAMTAEMFGKKSGLSGGRGGHMHLFDARTNFASSGIIGQGLGPTVGAALARKMKGSDDVGVAFLGDGAANQGAFHEALNLAAIWKAPVVFVIEDNAYGISIAKKDCTAVASNVSRAAGYGMPGVLVKNNDPDAVYAAASEAIARARAGEGPTLIEIETTRLEGHFMGDAEGYRPEGEVEALKKRDPIPLYRARLVFEGFEESELLRAEEQARTEVDNAFAYARSAQFPEFAEAFEHVFADRKS